MLKPASHAYFHIFFGEPVILADAPVISNTGGSKYIPSFRASFGQGIAPNSPSFPSQAGLEGRKAA